MGRKAVNFALVAPSTIPVRGKRGEASTAYGEGVQQQLDETTRRAKQAA